MVDLVFLVRFANSWCRREDSHTQGISSHIFNMLILFYVNIPMFVVSFDSQTMGNPRNPLQLEAYCLLCMTRHELGRFAQREVDLNKVETLR